MGICIKSSAFTEFKLEPKTSHTEHSYSSDSQILHNFEALNEVYQLEEVVGQGSFGVVRLAHKINDPEFKVAVKSVPKSMIGGSLSSIKTEFRILSCTHHPNIVRLYDAFDDCYYFHVVLEYCSGGELLEKIKKQGKITEDVTCKYMEKMLKAVNHLHENNISHRDIKPQNFLFENNSEDAELKLIDFGLSKQFKRDNIDRTRMTSFVGTPLYIAPEVINGNYGEKCDVWGLGVVFYLMLTGTYPFDGPKASDIYKCVMREKVKFDSQVFAEVSILAKDLLGQMLNKDHGKRPSAKQALNHPWFKFKDSIESN